MIHMVCYNKLPTFLHIILYIKKMGLSNMYKFVHIKTNKSNLLFNTWILCTTLPFQNTCRIVVIYIIHTTHFNHTF